MVLVLACGVLVWPGPRAASGVPAPPSLGVPKEGCGELLEVACSNRGGDDIFLARELIGRLDTQGLYDR